MSIPKKIFSQCNHFEAAVMKFKYPDLSLLVYGCYDYYNIGNTVDKK